MWAADRFTVVCGIGEWNLPSGPARLQSFNDYIQQVDSVWQCATGESLAEGDSNRVAVMDSLRMLQVSLEESGTTPEFKFCKMGEFVFEGGAVQI